MKTVRDSYAVLHFPDIEYGHTDDSNKKQSSAKTRAKADPFTPVRAYR